MSISPASWIDRLEVALAQARTGEDPEGVHQVRVATRRLVTWLDLAGRSDQRDALQRLRRRVSAARDLDVLLGRDLPAPFSAWLRARCGAERGAVVAAADDPASAELVLALRREPATPRLIAERGLLRLIRRALRRGSVLSELSPEVEAVHDLRRAIRPVRYALDWLGESDGAVRPIQDDLGRYNDAVVLQDALKAWGGDAPEVVAEARFERAAALDQARLRWPAVREALVALIDRFAPRAEQGV